MTLTVLKSTFEKLNPIKTVYGNYDKFEKAPFKNNYKGRLQCLNNYKL